MTEETDYDPIPCPVGDCTYRDRIRSVAGHVSRRNDDAHSWDRFDYDGARDFVMTEKRRQRGELDGDRASGEASEKTTGDSSTDSTATDSGRSPGTPHDSAEIEATDIEEDDFELGFERDALVLLELARKYDLSSLDDLGTFQLADLYSLLADLKNSADDARKEVRDELLEQVREDRSISADLGSVNRTTYQYRRVRDEQAVRDALADADVDPEEVRGFDKSKLKDAIEDADLDEDAVFDIEKRPQIRISDSNDDRRRERFERLDDEIRSLADER
ncbi:hypothetical protein [Halorussus lipolyticus]|uniref:hypothetical protein n=1 Tax=Halorussus lipolyticus TaxID=3034024 RepID=UPI0023E8C8E4|nr:hypothetical protein [Halorussus sp. DT80]